MKIFVAGGNGFLGKRVCRKLNEMKLDYIKNSLRDGLDYRKLDELKDFFNREKIDIVLNCATYTGGIQFGYKHPAEMFYNNMLMILNFLECTRIFKFKRLVNPISNCSYPSNINCQKEENYWDGPLHESVLSYGFTRKASWVGSWSYNKQYNTDWINLIFPNMYGPGDHFDEERSHALGALIMKIVQAKEENLPEVIVWGTGKPVREWMHIDDGAEAMIRAMYIKPYIDPINIGTGKGGISIIDLAKLIKRLVKYDGSLILDKSKQDGAPYKTIDVLRGKKLFMWKPKINLEAGIKSTINWYLKNRLSLN